MAVSDQAIPESAAGHGRPAGLGAHPVATLTVASLATALVLLVFTVPLTTMTATVQALDASVTAQAWIYSAMSIGAAAGLLGSGAIGDELGRRRTFVAGTLLLGLASLIAALAPTALWLVVARLLQGLGGAAILACSLGLIGQAWSGPALARATGIWGAALGAGVALGPILWSELVKVGGWRLPHTVSTVAALLLAVVGRRWLSESRASQRRPIDVLGMLLFAAATTCLLAGLTQLRVDWRGPLVWGLLAAGGAGLAGFVQVQRRSRAPMLDLALFRRADFTAASVAALASGAGVLSLMSLVPVMVERVMGRDTLSAAIVLVAWSATSSVTAFASRWLPGTPRQLLIGGLLGCAIGQLAIYAIGPDSGWAQLLPGLFIAGAANGILNAALGHQAVASVPLDRSAMGSGANNTARYLGSATGLTI
ncbi:MAG: MFS transporter, partial [Xanthomonadales bacterium]|nr:MFS transporter [Xanthomonadales bacterium]